jgi:renalase
MSKQFFSSFSIFYLFIFLTLHNFSFYNSLLMSKTLEPLNCKIEGLKDFPEGTRHFVAPAGTNSVVKHFFATGGHQIHFERHIVAIDLQADNKWLVKTKSGQEHVFDAIILTMPVPQILQLKGRINNIIGNIFLQKIIFSKRSN